LKVCELCKRELAVIELFSPTLSDVEIESLEVRKSALQIHCTYLFQKCVDFGVV